MPMAFVFAIWVTISIVGQNYLWVIEKGKWVGATMAVGLTTNVILNCIMLPIRGLHGAIVATLIANGTISLGLWLAMARNGYELDGTTVYATRLPAMLLVSPWLAFGLAVIAPVANPHAKAWTIEGLNLVISKISPKHATT
jgi:O-antigen/teichoic acid export membrane protein